VNLIERLDNLVKKLREAEEDTDMNASTEMDTEEEASPEDVALEIAQRTMADAVLLLRNEFSELSLSAASQLLAKAFRSDKAVQPSGIAKAARIAKVAGGGIKSKLMRRASQIRRTAFGGE